MRSPALLLVPILVAALGANAFARGGLRVWIVRSKPVGSAPYYDGQRVVFRGKGRHEAATALANYAATLGDPDIQHSRRIAHTVTILYLGEPLRQRVAHEAHRIVYSINHPPQ
jgi:hypothetical protein